MQCQACSCSRPSTSSPRSQMEVYFLHFQKGNQGKVSPLEPPFKITYFRRTACKCVGVFFIPSHLITSDNSPKGNSTPFRIVLVIFIFIDKQIFYFIPYNSINCDHVFMIKHNSRYAGLLLKLVDPPVSPKVIPVVLETVMYGGSYLFLVKYSITL